MEDDESLGLTRPISRRDFLNGTAFCAAAALNLLAVEQARAEKPSFAQESQGYYPPALTGMRGSGAGTFEVAHDLRDGKFKEPFSGVIPDGSFDLIVVGAGISGLAAAYFYKKKNPSSKILLLDNHDDFGGHATRNEFRPGGRLLLVNGGCADIESPFDFSKVARGLMDELGVDPVKLSKKCNADTYDNLDSACFFDKETFGTDKLVTGNPGRRGSLDERKKFLANTPFSARAQAQMIKLYDGSEDFLPGVSSKEKKDRLTRISYKDFLLKHAKVDDAIVRFFQTDTQDLYGVGIDAVNALDCWALGLPGFAGMKLEPGPHPRMGYTARGFASASASDEDYEFHYPDGNASVARLLMRSLIPGVLTGRDSEDIVTSSCDYSQLDQEKNDVRLKLSSTVVRVKHNSQKSEVEVTYSRGKKTLYSAKAKGVVMACWNMLLPHLCPELTKEQKSALLYGVKVPLIYTNVALKNWKSFKNLGISRVSCPGMYHPYLTLERAVNIGSYKAPASPDEPIVVRMIRTPCLPGQDERAQHKLGRFELLTTSFETFEKKIRDQLNRVLSAGGFDPARDIEAITVNRWAHGYAYEYNHLFDPDWAPGQAPCEIARKPFGRITIANADSAAAAYTDQAIDQAYRAVQELPLS